MCVVVCVCVSVWVQHIGKGDTLAMKGMKGERERFECSGEREPQQKSLH